VNGTVAGGQSGGRPGSPLKKSISLDSEELSPPPEDSAEVVLTSDAFVKAATTASNGLEAAVEVEDVKMADVEDSPVVFVGSSWLAHDS
jgi:hypothetical protein